MGQFQLSKKHDQEDEPKEGNDNEKSQPVQKKVNPAVKKKKPPPKFRPSTFVSKPREQLAENIKISKVEYSPIINDSIIVNIRDKPLLPKVGTVLGKCKLKKRIGKGSSCLVFTALHQTLLIVVAVKVFIPDKGGNMDSLNRFRQQFKIEAQMLAKLNNPHIVRVLDFEDSQLPYIILEYIDGDSLLDLIKKNGPLSPEEACRIIYSVAEGLETAHDNGIIHRDLKPENILMSKDGGVKLADLGIARITSGFQGEIGKKERGILCGTPAYVAPEQALDSESADARSDMYSLGATFYHIITGKYPFEANSIEEMVSKHISEPLTPPNQVRKDISKQISETIEIMMNKDPRKRFEIQELKSILKSFLPSDEMDAKTKELINKQKEDGTSTVTVIRRAITNLFSKG